MSKLSLEEKTDAMRKIRDEVFALTESPLYSYRTENGYHAVLGEGSHEAAIMFIGEAPGENEAKTGRPFCGRAGKLLDDLLASVGIPREAVYITNIVKDRPPKNRDPFPEEIALYAPYLDRQIAVIEPSVIVSLGRHAMTYLMRKFGIPEETITSAHGKVFEIQGVSEGTKFIPMYHPAAAIYTRALLETLKEDFKQLTHFYDPTA